MLMADRSSNRCTGGQGIVKRRRNRVNGIFPGKWLFRMNINKFCSIPPTRLMYILIYCRTGYKSARIPKYKRRGYLECDILLRYEGIREFIEKFGGGALTFEIIRYISQRNSKRIFRPLGAQLLCSAGDW